MAQFIAFEENVEVYGQSILAVLKALDAGQEFRQKILAKHGIIVEPEKWLPQQSWLNAFREISETIGQRTLFMIGKAIPEYAEFPPDINTLEQALNTAYHMNHRNGEIGHYQVASFDEIKKEAIMVCKNPYPSEFDRGIITSLLRQFKPKLSFKYEVILGTSKETRINGGDSCTFRIVW